MALSKQRLGDDPRDHDGTFTGFYPRSSADVNGLKPNCDDTECENPKSAEQGDDVDSIKPWNIYPPPPPPHWKWQPSDSGVKPEREGNGAGGGDSQGRGDEAESNSHQYFDFSQCEIPGEDGGHECDFEMNDEGVFVVYPRGSGAGTGVLEGSGKGKGKGKEPIQRIPDLREYFTDLDYLLGVCSDGPAKSFAFRRLKYLASKWSLYCLLNEYQELADMKVGLVIFLGSFAIMAFRLGIGLMEFSDRLFHIGESCIPLSHQTTVRSGEGLVIGIRSYADIPPLATFTTSVKSIPIFTIRRV